MIKPLWVKIIVAGCLLPALAGCSVAMALIGSPDPDFNAFGIGSTRAEVESQLGHASISKPLRNGKHVDTYRVEFGNTSNWARALSNFYADLVSFGLWEFPGTILEATWGHDEEVHVTYDGEERVLAVDGYHPPVSSDATKETVTTQQIPERAPPSPLEKGNP